MAKIEKVTQGFDPAEDRLFFDVSLAGGEAQRLWLTQRLARVLVQHLCMWLDDQLAATASGHHDHRLHAFEQQVATAAMRPETAVEAPRPAGLVHHVDVDRGEQVLRVTFRTAGESSGPQMTLDPVHLRQWLGIVHGLFAQAGWPTDGWPAWLTTRTGATATPPGIVH